MTDDLSTWLLEQVAEDERTAMAVSGEDDVWNGEHLDLWVIDDDRKHNTLATTRRRVLAQCEAKRRIVADVVPKIDALDDALEGEYGAGAPVGLHEESRLLLKLLAYDYADRPGYQESWMPT